MRDRFPCEAIRVAMLFTLPVFQLNVVPSVDCTDAGTQRTEMKSEKDTLSALEREGWSITRYGPPGSVDGYSVTTPDDRTEPAQPRQLNGLHNIRSLSLSGPRLKDSALLEAECLDTIQELRLNGIRCGHRLLARLYGNKSLRTLSLIGAGIADRELEGIGNLLQLDALFLRRNPISDGGLTSLSPLPKLRLLDLGGTHIRDPALAAIADRLRQLEVLDLDGTQITDAGIRALAELPRLSEPNLSRTHVSNAAANALRLLRGLHTLGVCETDVSDGFLEGVCEMTAIERLYIGKTKITGNSFGALKNVSRLRVLGIQWLNVSN